MGFDIGNSDSIRKVITIFIGFVVVVSLTLIVYNDIQDGVFRVKYKQAFAKANYAWQNTVMSKDLKFTFSSKNHIQNFLVFRQNFTTRISCDKDNMDECWGKGEDFFLIYPDKVSFSFIDDRGMSWANACSFDCAGEILVDVNGIELPNKYGKDRFVFYPSTSGVGYRLNKPLSLAPLEDYKYVNEYFCPSGNCLYQSWLY